MNIKPIRTEKDYDYALAQIDAIFDAQPRTTDGNLLELLTLLVEAYEEQHYPIAPPDPIVAIISNRSASTLPVLLETIGQPLGILQINN